MMKIGRWAVAAAAAILSCVSAQAADLYGGRGSIKDYEYAPPAAQRAFYVRIDGGYSWAMEPGLYQWDRSFITRDLEESWTLGGGVGMYFSRGFRADLTYDHRFEADVSGTTYGGGYNGTRRLGLSADVILANLYYDFQGHGMFTPYVGFGVGAARVQTTKGWAVDIGCGCGTGFATGGGEDWNFAAAAMLGLNIKLHDRLSLDTGYRYVYMGDGHTTVADLSSASTGGVIRVEDLTAHEFRVGLRWDIR